MNVVVVPIGNNVVIKTLATGAPYVVSGQAGTALAMQYLVGTMVAGVAFLGGVVVMAELMKPAHYTDSIRYHWVGAGREVKSRPKPESTEQKSILQIWKEEGERVRAK